ncbi:MAG: Dipeptidyl aminopeptidase/acylaminoacyl-peptidase-like protein [Bradyrhizobium sp.]|nr:Dipeptidyl aminopeptidase/acylaminoacyl-peptidase-like protein [Bradyrhizobium sp.]
MVLALALLASPMGTVSSASASQISLVVDCPQPSSKIVPDRDAGLSAAELLASPDIRSPLTSPDGKVVAFLSTKLVGTCGDTRRAAFRTTLFIILLGDPTRPIKIAEADSIRSLSWRGNSSQLTMLRSDKGRERLWQVDPLRAGAPEGEDLRLSAPNGGAIEAYRWDNSGRKIALVERTAPDPTILSEMQRRGFRFDDRTMWRDSLKSGHEADFTAKTQLVLVDMNSTDRTVLWTSGKTLTPGIESLAWSPDDQHIAFVAKSSGVSNFAVHLVDPASQNDVTLDDDDSHKWSLTWSPAGDRIAFLEVRESASSSVAVVSVDSHRKSLAAKGLIRGNDSWLAWNGSGKSLLFSAAGIDTGRLTTGIYLLEGTTPHRLTSSSIKVSDCEEGRGAVISCVAQSPIEPPLPALLDVRTGRVRLLGAPSGQPIPLSKLLRVKELHWRNALGKETNGFLITKTGLPPRPKLPLVLMAYGFDGDYLARPNPALSNYPAAALAGDGIAVLLFNYPADLDAPQSFSQTLQSVAMQPLSSAETVVADLSKSGLIDARRVGYAGHSFGGYLVQYALEHSSLLAAAEIHNGGTSVEPESYTFTGNAVWREGTARRMGGPPWGATLKNYEQLSAKMNASLVQAPVLMEFENEELTPAIDFFGALRDASKAVDLFVYPNDGHVFTKPEHIIASSERISDWFRFWLQDLEDPNPDKASQYSVWREYRRRPVAGAKHD